MALAGAGVLAIWNGIAEVAEADFIAWHIGEHIPERVSVPGFLRGRRYCAIEGQPKYFNFYETEDWHTLTSPAYMERLNAPSEWTTRVVRHFQDTSRTMCSLACSEGRGDGAWIATCRLGARQEREAFIAAMKAQIISPTLATPSIVAVHLLEGQRAQNDAPTAEKALRGQPDAVAEWILLVEAVDAAPLQQAMAEIFSEEALRAAGARYDQKRDGGIYRLQYSLSRSQLGQGENSN